MRAGVWQSPRRLLVGAAALVIGWGAATAASAQVVPPRGGMRVDPGFEDSLPRRVDRRDALRIARSLGMADTRRVTRDGRRWRIEGVDRRGRPMRVVISRLTGEVLRISRR